MARQTTPQRAELIEICALIRQALAEQRTFPITEIRLRLRARRTARLDRAIGPLTRHQAAFMAAVSQARIDAEIASGALRAEVIGGELRIPVQAFREFVKKLDGYAKSELATLLLRLRDE